MRTTVNIHERILGRLKRAAERNGMSLTEMVNLALQAGLEKIQPEVASEPYRCPTYAMGEANFPIDKALQFAADLEDTLRLRKFHPFWAGTSLP